MDLNKRIAAFDTLGKFLGQFSGSSVEKKEDIPENDLFFDAFKMQIKRAREYNGWFTEDNILYAFESWSELLKKEILEKWVSGYHFKNKQRTVAVIMAGNIPLVGFHDFLSVLISGNRIKVKQSSNDRHFIPLIA
jgi:hypothetical protein